MTTVPKNLLTDTSYLGTVAVKATTSGLIFGITQKYLNNNAWTDPAVYRAAIGQFISSAISELLMTSIVQRLLSLQGSNAGIQKIWDQALNASIAGGLNIYAYDLLVTSAPGVGGEIWANHEEFVFGLISDVLADIIGSEYLAPLLGLNQTSVQTVYT